jgi:hypothetical protein
MDLNELKCRAKVAGTDTVVDGYFMEILGGNVGILVPPKPPEGIDIPEGCSVGAPIDLLTLQRTTMVPDINGKEIFGGCVVKLHVMAPGGQYRDGFIGVVTFYEGAWWADNNETKEGTPLFQQINKWEIIDNGNLDLAATGQEGGEA